jgi:hypothetical protein
MSDADRQAAFAATYNADPLTEEETSGLQHLEDSGLWRDVVICTCTVSHCMHELTLARVCVQAVSALRKKNSPLSATHKWFEQQQKFVKFRNAALKSHADGAVYLIDNTLHGVGWGSVTKTTTGQLLLTAMQREFNIQRSTG